MFLKWKESPWLVDNIKTILFAYKIKMILKISIINYPIMTIMQE